MLRASADTWLYRTDKGLFCEPGGFYIDPHRPVPRAIVSHGHGDHARPGHEAVLATPETVEIMKVRYGPNAAARFEMLACGREISLNGVTVRLAPAGHILGSAQIVIEWAGTRAVVSGDYKRATDPTCLPFEAVPCDVFVTEATFALPVFRHEPADKEVSRLLESIADQPERTHVLGVYGLGKCQRMLRLVRLAGYDEPVYLHGALAALTALYERFGIDFGKLRQATEASADELKGALVLCPPSALADLWSRRLSDPVTSFASGWMRVRGRARQRGIELPLVVSDHADWKELLDTVVETGAEDVWVTHGRDDALVYQLTKMGRNARALELVGREEEGG